MSENIFLAIVGVFITVVPAWKMIKNKSNYVYNGFLTALGIAVIIASIHKERKDIAREQAYQTSESLKNKKIDELIAFRHRDSVQATRTYIRDSIQAVYNRKYIIDSLNFKHEAQIDGLKRKFESSLEKNLNKKMTNAQKEQLIKDLLIYKDVRCVVIWGYAYSDSRLITQVEAFLLERGYQYMGSGHGLSTTTSVIQGVRVRGVNEINHCIIVDVGTF